MATPTEAYAAARAAIDAAEEDGRILVVIVSTPDGLGARLISNIPVTLMNELESFVNMAVDIAKKRFQN